MNIRNLKYLLVLSSLFIGSNAFSRNYEIPPSNSTRAEIPYISDANMELCIKNYNEAKWLLEEIDSTEVNQYSQTSVDDYNSKVAKHSKMIEDFNHNCAGYQSESAYKAAQKLNQQKNLFKQHRNIIDKKVYGVH